MAEAFSSFKGTAKKNKKELTASRSLLHFGNTPLSAVSSGRLSLKSNARLQKVTSKSLERLSFISEKDDGNEFENYSLEYSKYLLRKVQNRVLVQAKEEKEENVKKCFVSLKRELDELLDKYVKLSKEIGYFKIYLDIIKETNEKIEEGKMVLRVLKENDFERLMRSLSNSLENTINRLQLVDIDKNLIDEAFSMKTWGVGSEIDECLKKIDSCINKNKDFISKIAEELLEIKKLSLENEMLRERFHCVFQKVSNDVLESRYRIFTDIVKKAFHQREQKKSDFTLNNLECDLGLLHADFKLSSTYQESFQLSKLESSYPVTPNSASTPQRNQLSTIF